MASWITEESKKENSMNSEIPPEAMKMVEESRKGVEFPPPPKITPLPRPKPEPFPDDHPPFRKEDL